jgi:hypothetical protein
MFTNQPIRQADVVDSPRYCTICEDAHKIGDANADPCLASSRSQTVAKLRHNWFSQERKNERFYRQYLALVNDIVIRILDRALDHAQPAQPDKYNPPSEHSYIRSIMKIARQTARDKAIAYEKIIEHEKRILEDFPESYITNAARELRQEAKDRLITDLQFVMPSFTLQ